MDKIKALHVPFENGDLFCAGADWALDDLCNHLTIQTENGIDFITLCKRIISNQIYCFFKPRKISGLYKCLLFSSLMKKHNLRLTENNYLEALFLSNSEKAKELLGVTNEDLDNIRKETIWNGKFLY